MVPSWLQPLIRGFWLDTQAAHLSDLRVCHVSRGYTPVSCRVRPGWTGRANRHRSRGRWLRCVPGRLHRPRVNRRVAAVRGLFEFLVMRQGISASPVPAPRRSSGLRPVPRGLLGHLGPGRRRSGGRLVRQESRLPQSLPPADVAVFLSDLRSHRDRAVVLLMLLGGLLSLIHI